MPALCLLLLLSLASNAFSASPIFPLKDVRAGQHGIGKTVFTGDRIEEFQVEILGVLENMGPRQSIILARLSGWPLEKTGVIQGMSGSPVYIEGKLLGAVALAFSFSKDPIAGIRPIEDMLAVGDGVVREQRAGVAHGGGELHEIATPLAFNGFSAATIEHFADGIRKLGMEPRQGVSGGGRVPRKLGDPSHLHPGDMISVQLLSGDMNVAADGTVTEIDGNKLYAFGHRFLAVGGTELPFARADVITTLANVSSSFKISSAREWMGVITDDRSATVYGEIGKRAVTIPVTIALRGAGRTNLTYQMEMVNDRFLSPFLMQMAVFSAIDATERGPGVASFALQGEIEFESGMAPLKIDNTYSGDFGVSAQAALGIASPLSYLMGSGFDALKIRAIRLSIAASEKKQALQVDQIAVTKREVHPGDLVELAVTLAGENGVELTRMVSYRVPVGAPVGVLQFTVSDAMSANLTEFQQTIGVTPKSAAQAVSFLQGLRSNNAAYLRVWRTDTSFQVQGSDLPDPPPSVALLLAKSPATSQGTWLGRGSTVGHVRIDTGNAVVSGSKTVQVEVKE